MSRAGNAMVRVLARLAVATILVAIAFSAGILGSRSAEAQPTPLPKPGLPASSVPEQLVGIGIEQRLGEAIPLDLKFVDASGQKIALRDRLGERPVLLVPVYYDCPMLCGLVLESLSKSLRTFSLEVGQDFDIVIFSFDSTEGYELAATARKKTLRHFDSPDGWSFLTGSEESIRRLTDAIGYTAKRDSASGEMAHAAGIFVLAPGGKIARVFFGLNYPPRDLRLALVEAGEGKVGNFVDQVLLFCFRYDPATGRYSTAILRIVRAAGALTALGVGAFVFLSWRRERLRALKASAEGTA